MPVSIEQKLTEPEAIATAYGLLWLVSIDNVRRDSRRIQAARKLLLSLLTKDGQRDGIERAKRLEADGHLLPVALEGVEHLIGQHLEAMQQIRAALESFSHADRVVILAGVLGTEACEPNRSRTEALARLSYANRIACDRMEQEFAPEAS